MMRAGLITGLNFGVTSGVITTLGLMVGLYAGTHSLAAVMGGIATIAVADALSDALGIHLAKEADPAVSKRELWAATVATFVAKFTIAATFILPLLWLELPRAVVASVIWGLALLTVLSYLIARARKVAAVNVVLEHLLIALAVIAITHALGRWLGGLFPTS